MSETESLRHVTDGEDSRIFAGRSEVVVSVLGPGDCVGRYTIRAPIGAGGMGRVFAAFDPRLGREVALKVIRADGIHSSSRARSRLLREAQALARLNHTNVVTVYDVGTYGDEVFIAMELIPGVTLTRWLRTAKRSWREVIAAFVGAGRGLEAAHAVGIVHRDFKPENVIVGAERVVVVDFGLARAGPAGSARRDPQSPVLEADGLELELTLSGERMGTPLYMAPEQRAGSDVTAKADQFSFCVALSAALHGTPPGSDATLPHDTEVPGRVVAALLRGLARDPEARWPSMSELLLELSRDPPRLRRRIVLGAATLLLVGAAVWGLARPRAIDPCAGSGARLAGVWDAERRSSVHQAFAATKVAYSEDTWRRVSALLDDYAARWADMSIATCRATRVEGRQSDTLMDLRMQCLERRRAVLGALTDLWAHDLDARALEHAMSSTDDLLPFAECADAHGLAERAPLPSDPALVARIAAVRAHLDAAQALSLAYRDPEARKAATAARVEADATGWTPVRAEAAYLEGYVLVCLRDPGADSVLRQAASLAEAAHDDRLAARALIELVDDLAENQRAADRALLVADLADGMVTRAGDDLKLRLRFLRFRGQALVAAGRYDDARIVFEDARDRAIAAAGPSDADAVAAMQELARVANFQGNYASARVIGEANLVATIEHLGAEHPRGADILVELGNSALGEGDFDGAAGYFRRALVIQERISGPDAAPTALIVGDLGGAELGRGHLDEAQALLERALGIYDRVLGPDHVRSAATLTNLGNVRSKQGHYEEALALLRRGLALYSRAYGAAHDAVAYPLITIGELMEARGDEAGALGSYRQTLEIRDKALGADNVETLHSLSRVGRALARLHRCDEARPMLDTATVGLENAAGADHPYLAEALAATATCDLAEKREAEALARLERAIAVAEKAKAIPVDRGAVRWLLARALWATGQHAPAVAAAHTAEHELSADADGARDRDAARAWLAAR